MTKKSSEVTFVLEAIYKKNGGLFKYSRVLRIDNGPEFKGDATNCLKNRVNIGRAITKSKHTHTSFVEAFKKELEKLLFKPMDAQELQNPNKKSKIWVKNSCRKKVEQYNIIDEWYEAKRCT